MDKVFKKKQINILNAAEELIAKKGFEKTTVREIAEKANVNVAMISYYFGSKEQMMVSLYENRVEKTREAFSLFSQTIFNSSPSMQIAEIINFILNHCLKFSYFHGFVTQKLKIDADASIFLNNFYTLCHSRLKDIIQKGIEKGEFKNIVKSEDILASVIGTITFTIRNQFFYERFLPNHSEYLSTLEKHLSFFLKNMIFSLLNHQEEF